MAKGDEMSKQALEIVDGCPPAFAGHRNCSKWTEVYLLLDSMPIVDSDIQMRSDGWKGIVMDSVHDARMAARSFGLYYARLFGEKQSDWKLQTRTDRTPPDKVILWIRKIKI